MATAEDLFAPDEPVVRRCGELLQTEVDGEMIALDVEQGLCFGLNRTATRIWELIEEPKTPSQICIALVEEFEVAPEGCRAEVLALLASLREHRLVAFD